MSLLSFTGRQLKRLIYSCCLHLFTSPSLVKPFLSGFHPLHFTAVDPARSPKHFSVRILLGPQQHLEVDCSLLTIPCALSFPDSTLHGYLPLPWSFFPPVLCLLLFLTRPSNVGIPCDLCSSAKKNSRSDRVHKSVSNLLHPTV